MNDATDMAKGMMNIAEQRLLYNFPFHGRFVASWRVEAADFLATMGVTVQNGTILLFFNPAFVVTCSLPELENVLLHEVGHVLFEHVFADPAEFPNRWARVVAEEVSTNEWVSGPLPGHPVTLSQFPFLPADEDTATRYLKLVCQGRQTSPEPAGRVPNSQRSGPKIASSVPKTESIVPKKDSSVPKKGGVVPEIGMPEPLDDHSLWALARDSEQLNRIAVRVSIVDAKAALTPAEWAKVPPIFRKQIDKLVLVSTARGAEEEKLMPGTARINWKKTLQKCVRQAFTIVPSFQRPPRRFPQLAGLVPGKLHRPKGRVQAVIDTSGSISAATLSEISAELKKMNQCCEVVVVECDTVVRAVNRFSKEITSVHGRGGTDLRPPFQPDLLRKIHSDVIVYFTDGHGPAPAQAPRVPVIWCLTRGGVRPAPWGRVIQMT